MEFELEFPRKNERERRECWEEFDLLPNRGINEDEDGLLDKHPCWKIEGNTEPFDQLPNGKNRGENGSFDQLTRLMTNGCENGQHCVGVGETQMDVNVEKLACVPWEQKGEEEEEEDQQTKRPEEEERKNGGEERGEDEEEEHEHERVEEEEHEHKAEEEHLRKTTAESEIKTDEDTNEEEGDEEAWTRQTTIEDEGETEEDDRDKEGDEDEGEEEEKRDDEDATVLSECPECKREPLFYCVNDNMPLCYECGESDAHHKHKLQPHERALQDCREEVYRCMQPIFQSFKTLTKMQRASRQMARHIPEQSAHTEGQIRRQFEELRAFLKEEEEARLAAVREEFQRKARAQREATEQLRREACTLLHALKAGNMDMDMPGEDNVHFLQNYKTSVKRVWKAEQNPLPMKEKRLNSLIEMPKHVSNLRFRVWEKMQKICPYSPVTLDPNTAGPFLHVSDDLTRVRDSGFDTDTDDPVTDDDDAIVTGLPDNPERFSICGEMLGHIEGEGRHSDDDTTSWVVDVSDNSNWMVGVARPSVSRKSLVSACPDNGCWALSLRRFRYEALEAPAVTLPLVAMGSSNKGPGTVSTHTMLARGTPGPQKVKVRVSRETGRVCFTDADRHTHLYTFSPSQSSSSSSSSSTSSPDDEVFLPYFATSCQHCPLTVLPATVTVSTSLLPGPGGRLEEEEEDEEEEVEDEDDEEEEEEEKEKESHEKMYDGQSKLPRRKPHSVLSYLRIPESQQKHLTHTEL